jgi:cobalt-zinc-cadmium efflux system membrane fusion protein
VVYVDRFASNEPVAQAKVEIEGAGLKGVASEIAPGTYVLDVAAPLPPAKHPLTISVEAGDASISFPPRWIPPSVATEVHTHGWSEWVIWGVSGALLLVTGILFAVRRHKRAKKGI